MRNITDIQEITVKSSNYFPYISFNFEHDNSKCVKQIRNSKNTFICLNQQQCFYKIYLYLKLFILQQLTSKLLFLYLSLVRMLFAMWDNNAKFAFFFFKLCMIFSDLNVNMAVKKLLVMLVYIRPFTTNFFGDDKFNFKKCHRCKKCITV